MMIVKLNKKRTKEWFMGQHVDNTIYYTGLHYYDLINQTHIAMQDLPGNANAKG